MWPDAIRKKADKDRKEGRNKDRNEGKCEDRNGTKKLTRMEGMMK